MLLVHLCSNVIQCWKLENCGMYVLLDHVQFVLEEEGEQLYFYSYLKKLILCSNMSYHQTCKLAHNVIVENWPKSEFHCITFINDFEFGSNQKGVM